jgi:beta-lactamase regulating signal transducer with metallopeptidase domain
VVRMMTIAIDTLAALYRQPAAQSVAWALLQFVWQGTAIATVTAAALFLLRRGAADVRYVVASVGMALMLTLAVVTGAQRYQMLRSESASQSAVVFRDGMTFDRLEVSETPGAVQPQASRSSAAHSINWTAVLDVVPALWSAGVLFLTLRLLTGWMWMQRLRVQGVKVPAESIRYTAAQLAKRLHLRSTIAILESTRVDVPTVIGWLKPLVLLPASAIAALSPSQLEAILAHELAHVRRHDYLINLLQTIVETLLFYHPAVWWISRRIRIERENCCDDLAVSLCGDPIAYANALADLESLRSSIGSFRRLDRTAMAATGGSLLQRVRRLLGAPAAHSGGRPAWLAASAALLVIIGMTAGAEGLRTVVASKAAPPVLIRLTDPPRLAANTPPTEFWPHQSRTASQALNAGATAVAAHLHAAPAPVALSNLSIVPVEPTTAAKPQSTSQTRSGSHGNWSWSNNDEKLQVEYSGSFDFTDDDTDVRQMSPGSHLRISDGTWMLGIGNLFSGAHIVEISEHNGQIEHRYFVHGTEHSYEPEGRAWLQQNLPRFVRNTGIAAPSRVARLLKSGGVPAVLGEIARIDGNYVRGIYYRELLEQAALSPEQYRQVLAQASSEMRQSNYELSRLLIALADRLPNDEPSRTAYFNAASHLTGAYETGRVYSTLLKKGTASAQIVGGILDHLKTLHSDYEVSQLLLEIIAQQPLDAHNGSALLDVVAGMHGDFDRKRVLTEFLRHNSIEGDLRAPFFRAVDAMHGGYDRGQILMAVVSRQDVSRDTLKLAIHATENMPAHETSEVLLTIARGQTVTGDLRDVYIGAADRLSAYEQGQVMTALVRSERKR